MRKIGIASVVTLLWLACALAIDRWIVAPYCAACVKALTMDLRIRLPAAEFYYPRVSVLVLLIPPMVLLALYLVPWRHLRTAHEWRDALERWCLPWFWLIVLVVLTVVGESVFILLKNNLAAALTGVAEQFSLTMSLTVFRRYQPISLTASLFGLLGLLIGAYLFITKGVKQAFDRPST